MGGSLSCCGDVFTCCRKHENSAAVYTTNQKFGVGRDIDDAVLAATNKNIGQEGQLVNLLTLSIECQHLPNLDTFTRTDAMCILYQFKGQKLTQLTDISRNIWQEMGRTEVIMDNLNPQFIKSFPVEFHFEERQKFKIKIYDVDDFSPHASLDKHDYVGEVEFMLHEIVTSQNQQLRRKIQNDQFKTRNNGEIIITGDERSGLNNEMVEMGIQANFKDNSGYLFFIVSREIGQNHHVPVYKSEIRPHANQYDFQWTKFQSLTSTLCKEENDRDIRIEFFRSSKTGKHTYLGCSLLTLNDIRNNKTEYQISKGIKKIGDLKFYELRVAKKFTFLEYVFGGCEISLVVAVDFTLSNGNAKDLDSLHYFDPARNEYLQAISSVGSILQYYDSDKQIPLFGFGAKIPPVKRPSHCFAVNGDIFNPECDGLDGVIEAYRNAIKKIEFYGPTHFKECIKMAVDMAENEQVSQDNQKYYILLLLTDGIINDMQPTIDEIVRGSSLPLSIIIVGVGSEDFKSMEILDADDTPLYSNKLKKFMERDIVQFVPFRQFKNNPIMLAKQTLEEVPNQLLSYFDKKRIVPGQVQEEQKRQIQQKLSRVNTNQLQNQGPPPFFRTLQEKFIQQSLDMGMDFIDVKDFLEDKGIPEFSQELLIDYMKDPNYQNILRAKPVPKVAKQAGYEYYDPDEGVQQPMMLPPINLMQRQSAKKDECKICFQNKVETVLVPCGHRCLCSNCANGIKGLCPICRQRVQQVVKMYDA